MIDSLVEKYLDTIKNYAGNEIDIFVNPTKRDMREIKDSYGYRFIIDFYDKKIYMWSAMGAIHADIVKGLGLDRKKMTNGGYKDRYFTGTVDWLIPRIMSDIFEHGNYDSKHDDIQSMLNQDIKWLDKYIDTKELVKELELILKRF